MIMKNPQCLQLRTGRPAAGCRARTDQQVMYGIYLPSGDITSDLVLVRDEGLYWFPAILYIMENIL